MLHMFNIRTWQKWLTRFMNGRLAADICSMDGAQGRLCGLHVHSTKNPSPLSCTHGMLSVRTSCSDLEASDRTMLGASFTMYCLS